MNPVYLRVCIDVPGDFPLPEEEYYRHMRDLVEKLICEASAEDVFVKVDLIPAN